MIIESVHLEDIPEVNRGEAAVFVLKLPRTSTMLEVQSMRLMDCFSSSYLLYMYDDSSKSNASPKEFYFCVIPRGKSFSYEDLRIGGNSLKFLGSSDHKNFFQIV